MTIHWKYKSTGFSTFISPNKNVCFTWIYMCNKTKEVQEGWKERRSTLSVYITCWHDKDVCFVFFRWAASFHTLTTANTTIAMSKYLNSERRRFSVQKEPYQRWKLSHSNTTVQHRILEAASLYVQGVTWHLAFSCLKIQFLSMKVLGK